VFTPVREGTVPGEKKRSLEGRAEKKASTKKKNRTLAKRGRPTAIIALLGKKP